MGLVVVLVRLLPARGRRREDYLEAIYKLLVERGRVGVRELARELGVSPPSVVEYLRRLAEEGYIVYEKGGHIELTERGLAEAERIYRIHKAVKKFLMLVLGVDEETAERDACYIEHGLGEETVERIVRFIEYIEECPMGLPELLKQVHARIDKNNVLQGCPDTRGGAP